MKEKTFITMEYDEFEKLVNEHVPSAKGKYNYPAEEELSNGSSKTYLVEAKAPDEYEHEAIEKGKLRYQAYPLLSYLAWKGIIKPGNYLITVFW